MSEPKKKMVNVKLTQEEIDKLQAMAAERKMTQAEFLRQATLTAVFGDLGAAMPDLKDDIARFRAMSEEMTNCYVSAMERAAHAETHASALVRDRLATLEETIHENQKLRQTLEQTQLETTSLREELATAKTLLSSTEEVKAENDRLKTENSALKRQALDHEAEILSLKQAHAAELQRFQQDAFDRLMEFAKATKAIDSPKAIIHNENNSNADCP